MDGVGIRPQLGVKELRKDHTGLLQHGLRGDGGVGNGFFQNLIPAGLLQSGQHAAHGFHVQLTGGFFRTGGLFPAQLRHDIDKGVGCPGESQVSGFPVVRVLEDPVPSLKAGIGFLQFCKLLRALLSLDISLLHRGFVLFSHKHLHHGHFLRANGVGGRLRDAALLQADVHDIAHIVGQRQLQHGLPKEQKDRSQQKRQIGLQVPFQFQHDFLSFS